MAFRHRYIAGPLTMALFFVALMIALFTAGCVSYDPYNPYAPRDISDPVKTPIFEDAKASCYFEPAINDHVWHFEAWIHYPRHDFKQLKRAYVEVYDGEYLVDWFELYRDSGKYWDTKRIESYQTALYCEYFDDYEADFFAFDHKNESDIITVQDFN